MTHKPSVFPLSFSDASKSLIPSDPSLKPPAGFETLMWVSVCVRVKVWVMGGLLMENECDDGWVWQADGFACRLFNHTDSAGREGRALSRHGNKQETNLPTILSRTFPHGWCFWLSVRKTERVSASKYVFKKAQRTAFMWVLRTEFKDSALEIRRLNWVSISSCHSASLFCSSS